MTDFLLELRSEEIPARMQDKARADLERLFTEQMAAAGLKADGIATYATPRRLTLIARGLPLATQAVSEELKGPPADAPDAAVDGFLRKAGLTRDALQTREVKGRPTLFAVIDRPGRATGDVLAEAIPAIIRAFPWPKSMRWGQASLSTESQRWVRPLQGIVAMLGDEVIPCEIAGIASGNQTAGHRFHHPDPVALTGADSYVEALRAAHVIVDQDERRGLIRTRAAELAAEVGLSLIEDEGLVAENAGLTEWPVPLLGRFDADFLSVPPEVIQLTARVNQKYFVCNDAEGMLANAFICTANIDASDGGAAIVEGNRKVLAARLSDARFFYETDLKVPLEEQAKKLEKIVFHEKLGTVADKVERVAKLARWLVEEGIVTDRRPREGGGPSPEPSADAIAAGATELSLADMAERAARLAKADLVTGMVGEFPELQGLMGGYYAKAQGEDREVWEAVRDHYKPVGQGDEVPTAPVTVAVSLADKLDNVFSFFAVDELPTGSKDPQALRRASLAASALLTKNNLSVKLASAIDDVLTLLFERARVATFATQIFDECTHFVTVDSYDALDRSQPIYFYDVPPSDGNFVPPGSEREAEARSEWFIQAPAKTERRLLAFFADRLKVQQREAGVRHDLIDAVFALGGEDDLVRLLARVKALQAFMATEDGANLLAGYKRAANILKKEGWGSDPANPVTPADAGVHRAGGAGGEMDSGVRRNDELGSAGTIPPEKPLSYSPEPAEAALIDALEAAAPRAQAAMAAEDFEAAMAALASLRAPIDSFFDSVTVNDADPAKRAARLNLLARMRDAVHNVADFSKIEG